MRPQHSMYMQHPAHQGGQRMGGPFGPGGGQRPPNVQVGPEGMPMGSQQEWRHLLMTQQQNMSYNGNGMRPGFNPNHQRKLLLDKLQNSNIHLPLSIPATGFSMTNAGGPGMQMTPAQMQQQMLRQQQHQQQSQSNLQTTNVPHAIDQFLAQQQQQQGMMSQMQINSMHLSQSQTMTVQQQQQQSVMSSSFSQTQTQQHPTSQSMMVTNNSQQNETNSLPASSVANNADFNEFFENLPVGDTSGFLEQDLLNSLENIQDILQ